MDKQTINNVMSFMMRVQLTGQEVPAFNAAMNALQSEADRTHADGQPTSDDNVTRG